MEKKNDDLIRIALIGPESTAKSTLAEQLADHYTTNWVKEYSREYLAGLKREYTLEDVLFIAVEQLTRENALLEKSNNIIFADTELILSKVWCEDVFKTCPEWIKDNILPYQYDLYLLTYPDLPWEEDPVRENPHRRQFFFDWYERELKAINANYTVIRGEGRQRLENAIEAVDHFLLKKPKNNGHDFLGGTIDLLSEID